MKKGITCAILCVMFALSLLACSSKSSSDSTPSVPLETEFSSKPGQHISISGENLIVEFKSVSNDSRCPAGAQCVSAGNAEVNVELTKTGNSPFTVQLNTAGPDTANYLNYTIRVTDLQPNPTLGSTIPQSEYTAKLIVIKNQTPKSNAEAEQLSIEATGALVAPQDVYNRVDTELKAIRAAYPPAANIGAMPSWVLQKLSIGFDATGWNAVKAGTYTAWDALNKTYGVTEIDTSSLDLIGAAVLTFAGRYNIPLLSGEYAKLPDVRYASPDGILGDGNDVCLSIDGGNHFFIFDAGSGDCPAGCIQHIYWGYRVTLDGSITELGTWDSSSGNAQPAWLAGLPACRAWL